MRFWLWLTTGMVTKEWVAVHRKHHRFTDLDGDPHTPVKFGIWTVLFKGALLYKDASKDTEMVNIYGKGTPDDWIEKNVYSKYSALGILIMLYIDLLLFEYYGIGIWLLQMAWIPFWAAGVVNGVGHFVGYRNNNTKDKSTNILPLDIVVGGELLHNNHHNNPASPKLSLKWFEFDIGWMYLKIFETFKLAKINYGKTNTRKTSFSISRSKSK
jgi:stearoyl-CoA desaturase (delta-9 desaturase)